MLLYIKHYGQLCNRLWALLPVLSYALHKKKNLYVLFAKKGYVQLFPGLKDCGCVHFFFSHDDMTPKPLEWRMALFSEKHGLEIKEELRTVDKAGFLTFVDGWKHSSNQSYIKEHKSEIVELFRPEANVVSKVNSYFEKYDGLTIGVHIRRGDYQEYLGGKYYFSDTIYSDAIEHVRSLFSNDHINVRFLICSNEPFNNPNGFDDVFSIDHADGITDLYALSRCDYILGPPSSFSQWASFYGDVPLCVMLNIVQEIRKDSFSKIVLLDTFENGKKIRMNEEKQEYYIEE